ncbi:putative nucleolar pre-ribosomal-associated protein [Clavispora lusitaniae]|uniref:Nucleolar pre-ribosomal-associated protein n=1 Tax=Clavispora lusitaniae TaxID=36911 RepID=A0ACD0WR92_CLALS|nr:putative nucleolar pre-ribosomal-associated protein [Clavispora lusitaniae]QFZ35698.1 putative nucleolar pre-ribosomal-associated protein [Clavispora lusitaniae]QFZ41380.1 putative nucleolar pre-ribosomal-associated protein [Clavispora lusitaniae]QFZ47058.1 putative nucleolar pre-ribosomal-associated protein [Clavispora lusitaniae]QFZ52735.1 putative nucleolar pre-ribosomal-associated protein [Clavispora lusitaniae]
MAYLFRVPGAKWLSAHPWASRNEHREIKPISILHTISMDTLTTAESVTRFLRGKDTPVAQACEVASALLAHKLAVFLPNASHFVFDLVCDRIGDMSGKFRTWKLDAGLWELWKQLWADMGRSAVDRECRAASFRRVKLIPVMSAVLEQGHDELVDAMFDCVEELRTGFIDVDEYAAVGLLASHVQMLGERRSTKKDKTKGKDNDQTRGKDNDNKDKTKDTKDKTSKQIQFNGENEDALTKSQDATSDERLCRWTSAVAQIVWLARAAHRPTKKSQARLFDDVVPRAAHLLACRALPPPAAAELLALLVPCAFAPDTAPQLAQHLQRLAQDDKLSRAAAEYLFEQTIAHVAARDMAVCEAVFGALTCGALAALAEQLLAQLARVNRTLSPQFFANLYASERERESEGESGGESTSGRPNWRLLGLLVRLDPALALAQWEDVLGGAATLAPEESAQLAEDLARGFVAARDAPRFLADVFPQALAKVAAWADPQVLGRLAPVVRELTPVQARALAQKYTDARATVPLALLLEGLLQGGGAARAACRSTICAADLSEPRVAYLAMCLYGDAMTEEERENIQREENNEGKDEKEKNEKGKHNEKEKNEKEKDEKESASLNFLHLRMAELSANLSESLSAGAAQYISALSPTEVVPFAQRWLVLVDNMPQAREALVQRLFALSPQAFLSFVEAHGAVLFERRSLMAAFSARAASYGAKHAFFARVPPVVFRRFFAAHMPALWAAAQAERTPSAPDSAMRALAHVVRPATLASKAEWDFASLRRLVRPDSPESLQVARAVWEAQVRNFNDKPSAEYVTEALRSLTQALDAEDSNDKNKSKNKNTKDKNKNKNKDKNNDNADISGHADRALAGVVLAAPPPAAAEAQALLAGLCGQFVARVVSAARSTADPAAAVRELTQLSHIPAGARAEVRAAVRDLGAHATDAASRALLFALVTKIASDPLYVTGLYVALASEWSEIEQPEQQKEQQEQQPEQQKEQQPEVPAPLEALGVFYSRLSAADFSAVFSHVLASLALPDLDRAFVAPLVDAAACLLPLLSKDRAREHTRLFVASLSAFRAHAVPRASALRFVRALIAMFSSHVWACSQYMVECVLSWAAHPTNTPNKGTSTNTDKKTTSMDRTTTSTDGSVNSGTVAASDASLYIATVNLVSYVVLFHRFRLSRRYHLVVGAVSRLMARMPREKAAASALARLLVALCDPQTQASARDSDSLTSEANIYKKAVRRHAHVLLVNYIHQQLADPMANAMTEALRPGIFSVFSLLSGAELNLVNQCLDSSGRAYYRKLYSAYKDQGKWHDI